MRTGCALERESQDQYAISSYKRALEAHEKDLFQDELIKIQVKSRRGETIEITRDEELDRVNFDKITGLLPVFQSDGTVTAANASSINDGAAAVLLMNRKSIGIGHSSTCTRYQSCQCSLKT